MTNNCKLLEKQHKIEINNFLYNVKWLRTHHKLSKKQMSKILGISIGSLNKIEQGIMPPRLSAKIIINIYYHFGIYSKEMLMKRFKQ